MDDIKKWFFYTTLGISLVLTVWFWSTIQFTSLLSIGLIFTLWGINLRDERKGQHIEPLYNYSAGSERLNLNTRHKI